jgi:hypothetical protein
MNSRLNEPRRHKGGIVIKWKLNSLSPVGIRGRTGYDYHDRSDGAANTGGLR